MQQAAIEPDGENVEYDDKAIRFLEALWGEGYLSPGGHEEVERIVADLDFNEKVVLDIGCGTGGITLYLASTKPLKHITGFDVERPVIDVASSRARETGLSERSHFIQAGPGTLPFEDASFDIIFSKDALIHVHDKEAVFADIFRVLKPGGQFAASDWLTSQDGDPSPLMQAYLKAEGLSFGMASAERYAKAMKSAGFQNVSTLNRNSWYREVARSELDRLKGPLYETVASAVGAGYVDKNIETWTAMQKVLDSAEHCPTHLFGTKP